MNGHPLACICKETLLGPIFWGMSPEDLLKRKELLLGPIFWGLPYKERAPDTTCNVQLPPAKGLQTAQGLPGLAAGFLLPSLYRLRRHLSTLGPGYLLQNSCLSHAQIENQIVSPGKDKTFFIYKGPQPSKPCFLLFIFPHLSLTASS